MPDDTKLVGTDDYKDRVKRGMRVEKGKNEALSWLRFLDSYYTTAPRKKTRAKIRWLTIDLKRVSKRQRSRGFER